jgi:diguanylate cyclase (GGDEF)-like protein
MSTLTDVFKKVGAKMTEATECSQALTRLIVSSIFVVYFAVTAPSILPYLAVFMGIACLWLLWVLNTPTFPMRQYAGIVFDNAVISMVLFILGPGHTGIVLMYFWVMIGNGYRFSSFHALISIVAMVFTFWVTALTSPKWAGYIPSAIEITIGYVLISWFVRHVMQNLERAISSAESHKRTAKRFEAEAKHDGLTGLCKRELAQEYLKEAEQDGRRVGVLFIDLDNFKKFNDDYGHHVGDQVLINISKRLLRCVREFDIACRYAGDEFIVVANDEDRSTINTIANRIRHEMDMPMNIEGVPLLHVTCSIGVAMLGVHGRTGKDVIRNADTAMYIAKRQGRNQVAWFDDKTDS